MTSTFRHVEVKWQYIGERPFDATDGIRAYAHLCRMRCEQWLKSLKVYYISAELCIFAIFGPSGHISDKIFFDAADVEKAFNSWISFMVLWDMP